MIKHLMTLAVFILISAPAQANRSETLSGLLTEVKQFSASDRALNQKREQLFDADLEQQQQLLQRSKQRLETAKAEQQRLKELFDTNDVMLGEMEVVLQQRSGQLGEVFGVAKEEATELRSLLEDSLTSADNPGRSAMLAFAESKRVPTIKELEMLWYQMQLEMTESGRINQFETKVISADGQTAEKPVIRFGLFGAATAEGQFLKWDMSQQMLTALPTQPKGGANQISAFLAGSNNEILVDPTRGQLFSLLDRMPKLLERIHQGAEVGYAIITLGVIGILIALYRIQVMLQMEMRVKSQLRNGSELSDDNALGRVMLAASAAELTPEQRELKVDEAILHEIPSLERGQSVVKLLATVAPLLGLLGTVVGMIATFQSITLFGNSDPKLMAGGISQALMTTVMGLVVAIPLMFSHSFLASRSRRLAQILQGKSLGLLADVQGR